MLNSNNNQYEEDDEEREALASSDHRSTSIALTPLRCLPSSSEPPSPPPVATPSNGTAVAQDPLRSADHINARIDQLSK